MRRAGYLFEQVVAFSNLLAAHQRARRGKRGRPSVERFTRRLEPELIQLQGELSAGTYHPGRPVTFEVWDPKRRTISVAPFRDRVAHHAVIGVIQPHLERGFEPDSYGCRVGKGTDGALARAIQLARGHPACLKTDVAQFFASVNHDVLLQQLHRSFKDRRLLELIEAIIRPGGSGGRGLPIGNLTSQWFANLYLTPFDRWLRQRSACRGLVRYMDDVLVFGRGVAALRELQCEAARLAESQLRVRLKDSVTQVYSTRAGVLFLGLRVGRSGAAIRRPTWRRLTGRIRRREWEYRQGRLTLEELSASVSSTLAHLERAPTRGLRRVWLAERAPVEW